MKISVLILGLFIGCITFVGNSHTAIAQPSIFNGAGIRMTQQPEVEPQPVKSKSTFSRWFSRETPEDALLGQPPKWPSWNPFKRSQEEDPMGYTERPNPFQNLPRLFPERDPDQPNVFQEWNQKSKDFFEERRQSFDDWAFRTNENMRMRSANTWEAITNGLKPDRSQSRTVGPFDWLKPKTNQQPPAQPPIRSAQIPADTPTIKF